LSVPATVGDSSPPARRTPFGPNIVELVGRIREHDARTDGRRRPPTGPNGWVEAWPAVEQGPAGSHVSPGQHKNVVSPGPRERCCSSPPPPHRRGHRSTKNAAQQATPTAGAPYPPQKTRQLASHYLSWNHDQKTPPGPPATLQQIQPAPRTRLRGVSLKAGFRPRTRPGRGRDGTGDHPPPIHTASITHHDGPRQQRSLQNHRPAPSSTPTPAPSQPRRRPAPHRTRPKRAANDDQKRRPHGPR